MKKFGLIGYPLGHSFSRNFFNEKFHSELIDAEYVNFEIPTIEDLPKVIAANPNLAGFNVTIPYKEQVIPFLDAIDKDAEAIGAINVVKVQHVKGKVVLTGFNSDVMGFVQSIESMLEPQHKKALILGTGGASKAINHGLHQLGLETLFVSRNRHDEHTITYEEITPAIMDEYKVIVNCTPIGMYPKADECPNIPYEYLTPKHLLYDLLYNPDTTLFMKKGSDKGAVVKNGLEMLLLQAFGSWDIWNR